jgi:hypothetical protein
VSVIEPSDAVIAGMAIQAEVRRLALRASLRPQLDLWLVGTDCLLGSLPLTKGPIGYP